MPPELSDPDSVRTSVLQSRTCKEIAGEGNARKMDQGLRACRAQSCPRAGLRAHRHPREIGVRMALGARTNSVRWMFVRQGGQVALLGVVGGALAAAGLTKYIQTLLVGVGRLDLIAFAGMSAVMLAVALLASYIPARRASRVDPVVALRAEYRRPLP